MKNLLLTIAFLFIAVSGAVAQGKSSASSLAGSEVLRLINESIVADLEKTLQEALKSGFDPSHAYIKRVQGHIDRLKPGTYDATIEFLLVRGNVAGVTRTQSGEPARDLALVQILQNDRMIRLLEKKGP